MNLDIEEIFRKQQEINKKNMFENDIDTCLLDLIFSAKFASKYFFDEKNTELYNSHLEDLIRYTIRLVNALNAHKNLTKEIL